MSVRREMKTLYFSLFLLFVPTARAQPFSFGVKGGIPLTDYVYTFPTEVHTHTNPYVVGLDAEARLPLGLSVEADALYRHLNYTAQNCFTPGCIDSKTTANNWEFGLLAKCRLGRRRVRPFADTGLAWDTLTGLRQTTVGENIFDGTTSVQTTSHPAQLNQRTTPGFVIGGGLDVHVLTFHVSPEIRYTHWASQQFFLLSNQSQTEFLVGTSF